MPDTISKDQKIANMKEAMEIRNRLFNLANSFAGDETGWCAVYLHRACNQISLAHDKMKYDLGMEID